MEANSPYIKKTTTYHVKLRVDRQLSANIYKTKRKDKPASWTLAPHYNSYRVKAHNMQHHHIYIYIYTHICTTPNPCIQIHTQPTNWQVIDNPFMLLDCRSCWSHIWYGNNTLDMDEHCMISHMSMFSYTSFWPKHPDTIILYIRCTCWPHLQPSSNNNWFGFDVLLIQPCTTHMAGVFPMVAWYVLRYINNTQKHNKTTTRDVACVLPSNVTHLYNAHAYIYIYICIYIGTLANGCNDVVWDWGWALLCQWLDGVWWWGGVMGGTSWIQ